MYAVSMAFYLFIDNVMSKSIRHFVSEEFCGEVGVLLFADDMVVIAESEERLQHNYR